MLHHPTIPEEKSKKKTKTENTTPPPHRLQEQASIQLLSS